MTNPLNSNDIFPFASLNNDQLINVFDIYTDQPKAPCKGTKCGDCHKKIINKIRYAFCTNCNQFYHLICSKLTKKDFPLKNWECNKCCIQNLPLSGINNDDFILTAHGYDSPSAEILKNIPTFSIKTLLDQLPGEKFSKDEFVSNTVDSKYYTPAEFINGKLSKKKFTMIHLNIASLQRHIDELRTLLTLISHPFDIIAITETRLHDQTPLVDVNIEGYDFHHKETLSQNGGAAIYIKSCHDYEVLDNYSVTHKNICESLFIEIKNKHHKNLLIGCIYRHHSAIDMFRSEYLDKILLKITKSKKMCALLGDFNIDLINYDAHSGISDFYDHISTHGFRPLILQPTRVTSTSATLIDNIFINDLSCFSKGGNLISAISDHFLQFSQIDIHNNVKYDKKKLSLRNWRIFNKREFEDELRNINWNNILKPEMKTNNCLNLFYNTTTKLLDEMAPFKRLTKKEISLKQRPWITNCILISM